MSAYTDELDRLALAERAGRPLAIYVIATDGTRRAGPFADHDAALDALGALHAAEGTGCMDLDLEIAEEGRP